MERICIIGGSGTGKTTLSINLSKELKMSWEFSWLVINWRKNKRNEIIEKISKIDNNKVHVFYKRKQLNKWYENTFGKKMEY